MYYCEMTDETRIVFIGEILEYAQSDSAALEMIKDFINDERNTDEIEAELFAK